MSLPRVLFFLNILCIIFFQVYKGVVDVMAKMWVQEGALSLYQGLWPALIQIGPYAGFQFASYKYARLTYIKCKQNNI